MFDILVNGQVVAIAAESVVKLFMNALIGALPTEVSITAKKHDIGEEAPKTEEANA